MTTKTGNEILGNILSDLNELESYAVDNGLDDIVPKISSLFEKYDKMILQ